jgi:hypothetical protein
LIELAYRADKEMLDSLLWSEEIDPFPEYSKFSEINSGLGLKRFISAEVQLVSWT